MIIASISLLFLLAWIGSAMWLRSYESEGIFESVVLGCFAAFYGMFLIGFVLLLIYFIIAGCGGML